MNRTPSCAYPPARIKTAKDHAQTLQCSRTRASEVRTSCTGIQHRDGLTATSGPTILLTANALPPVQNLRPGIVISSPIERCAAGLDELVHHAPLRAIARKALGGTRERAELLGASRTADGRVAYGHLLATCTDGLVRGALASRGAPIALVTGPMMVTTIRGTKEHLQTDR
jgi:hypothetical protein